MSVLLNMKFFVLFLMIWFVSVSATDIPWVEDNRYKDRLLYLHAFLNYEYNPYWRYNWERNLFSGNGFLYNVGSVTTHDLLVHGQLVINEELGAGWRFRGEGDWLETYHLDNVQKSTFMGLEKKIWKNNGLYLIVNPAYDKEYTDLNMGVLLADSSYENYLRLGLLYEDFVYDSKNAFDGKSIITPLSLQWRARIQRHNFGIYSEARISQGLSRRFPNPDKSPDITEYQEKINYLRAKLYYFPSDLSILSVAIYYYRYSQGKNYYQQEYDYEYRNQFIDFSFDYLTLLTNTDVLRFQMHLLTQSAGSEGYRAHQYDRQDLYGALSYERLFSSHRIELQYMIALPQWEYQSYTESYQNEQFVDKVKIGWTYSFPQGAQLQISVSHELQSGNFGGANLMTIILF